MNITVAIITVSDRSARGERKDLSGEEIKNWAQQKGFDIAEVIVVPDEFSVLRDNLIRICETEVRLILTTGGTGFAPRDITPEATLSVIEKHTPGFAEAMRSKSMEITPHAMLSRAVAGIRKKTLIINLPGSPKAVRENLAVIEKALPHAIDLINSNVTDCGSN